MFSGGPAKKQNYFMDNVPLTLGVKIRRDDKFYNKEAVESYKNATAKLNNL